MSDPELTPVELDLYNRGWQLMESGNWDSALKSFLASLEKREHFKTLEQIGTCYRNLKDSRQALHYYKCAYECNARNLKTATLYAEALLEFGEQTKAVEILRQCLTVNPSYGPAKELLERASRGVGDRGVTDQPPTPPSAPK